MVESLWQDVRRIRSTAPLVHNITNYVVMNTTANALLAVGASPVMAHAIEEVEEMVGHAGALVLNIGTLSESWIVAMLRAGKMAQERGIPVVFDPVGSGATRFRTETAQHILHEIRPAIIRGNASEIASLAGLAGGGKGVDSTRSTDSVVELAHALAEQWSCVVSISGETDVVVAEGRVVRLANGHPMMTRVTGLGCTATALTGAFAAVNSVPFQAAAHAMAVMGVAGEMAAERSAGPGSLQVHFLDVLYRLSESDLRERLQVQEG